MATLYFKGYDYPDQLLDWQSLSNWYMSYDAETNTYSNPATALPTSTDDVIAPEGIWLNSGSEPTVRNLTVATHAVQMNITVTGVCAADGFAFIYDCTITGNCVFNGNAQVSTLSTINGNCTFNDAASVTGGTINGKCTFNGSSGYTSGAVNDDCTFNGEMVYISSGVTIDGDATFRDGAFPRASGTTWLAAPIITGITRFQPAGAVNAINSLGLISTGVGPAVIEIIYDKGINGSSILGVV